MFKKILSPFSVILLTVFLDILGMSLLMPILPTIVRSFLSAELIQNDAFTHTIVVILSQITHDGVALANGIAFSIFSIGMFLGGFLFGRLSDRIGRKKALMLSTAIGVLGYLTFGFAPTFAIFLLGRFISGFSGAGMGVAQAYISDIFPAKERAAKMGMVGAAFGLAFAIGPVVGGLISHMGLQMVWFFSALALSINFILAAFVLPESKHHAHQMTHEQEAPTPFNFFAVLPIYIVTFLTTFGFSAMQSTFGMFLPDRFGASTDMVGYFMGIVGITSIAYQGFGIKYVRTVFLEKGMILLGLCVMMFAFLTFSINPIFILVPFLQMLFPIGFGSLNASSSALLVKLAPWHTGKALGTATSATSLASIFGPLFANYLYGISIVQIAPQAPVLVQQAGFLPFAFGAILFFIAAIFAYFSIRGQRIWTSKQ